MGTFNFSPRFSKADCFLIRLNTTQHSNYNKRDTKTKLSWAQQFLSNFGYPFSSNMKIYLKMMLLTIDYCPQRRFVKFHAITMYSIIRYFVFEKSGRCYWIVQGISQYCKLQFENSFTAEIIFVRNCLFQANLASVRNALYHA